MTKKKQNQYIEDIVSGVLPQQESFTQEEVRFLVKTALVWAGLQIEHELGEVLHEDVPQLVAVCEYKSIEDGIEDVQNGFEDEFLSLRDFISEWIA